MKILNLSHSHYLIQTLDFSSLPNLEKLILKDCSSLFKIDQSIRDLSNLVLVNLKDCKYLENLPRSFYKLKSLEILILFESLNETVMVFFNQKQQDTCIYIYSQWAPEIYKRENNFYTFTID
jgi:hypothetical protein